MRRSPMHCRIPLDPYSYAALTLLRAVLSILFGLPLGSFLLCLLQPSCVSAELWETACGYLRWLGVLLLFPVSGMLLNHICGSTQHADPLPYGKSSEPPGNPAAHSGKPVPGDGSRSLRDRQPRNTSEEGGKEILRLAFSRSAACGALAAAFVILLSFSTATLTGSVCCSFRAFSLFPLLFLLLCVVVQAGTEELIFRGTLLPALSAVSPQHPSAAILGSALCFALFHAANPGSGAMLILHTFLAGIFYALLCRRFGSLSASVAAHTVWNFGESILLGLPDSGVRLPYSVFTASSPLKTASFTFDPSSGLEGAWAPQLLLMIACLLLALSATKKYSQEIIQ